LELLALDALRPKRCPDPGFSIRECTVKQWQYNRFLYTTVGAQWKWTDKLTWSDDVWRAYAEADDLRTNVAYLDGSPAGYYELHTDSARDVQIAYFGLLPRFIGRGLGGPLLTDAIEVAFRCGGKRVWVHTCSLDHPAALANYQARGMSIYKTET
jgi:GNAT superfamily N-acetyltransferase